MSKNYGDDEFIKTIDNEIDGAWSYNDLPNDKRKRLAARRKIERLLEDRMLREQLEAYYDDRSLS